MALHSFLNLLPPVPLSSPKKKKHNREEVAASAPLIGDIEPLSSLEAEYADAGPAGAVFISKIRGLAPRYPALRRARGDGNCFFRSVLFAHAEGCVARRDTAERNRFVTRLRQAAAKLTGAGYEPLVFEDALETYADLLNRLENPTLTGSGGGGEEGPLTIGALEAAAREDGVANMYVMLLRLLVAAEVRAGWEDKYAPFAAGLHDDVAESACPVDAYVRRHVEPLGEDADHVCAVAAAAALGVPITVVYLDRSGAGGDGGGGGSEGAESAAATNAFAFDPDPPPGGGGSLPPRVTLLYRPGHYDILYPAGDAALGG
jgi:ubiquitin thioesterase protein OTUB1